MAAQGQRGGAQGAYHAPGGEGGAHQPAYAGHGTTAHGSASRGGAAAHAADHAGGPIRSRAVAGESGHGAEAGHETHAAAHGEAAGDHVKSAAEHGAGDKDRVAGRPATPTVMRSHGRLVLAGAAGHAAPRPFLRGDARPGAARDHAAVDRDRAFVHAHDGDFHTRNVRDFGVREMAAWRGGLWRNEWHYGRRGWWWDVGGVWYPYGNPIWPFPLIVAPLVAYDVATVDGPNLEAYEAPPPDASAAPAPDATAAPDASAAPATDGSPAPAPAPGAFQAPPGQAPSSEVASSAGGIPPLPAPPPGWYRCPDPSGYYPSVGACSSSWTLVQEAPPSGAN